MGFFHNYNLQITSNNTAVGNSTLIGNTTGYNDTAAGYKALMSNTTGYYNTAAGFQSLMSNTTGYYNTAAGSNALRDTTTGYYNTAAGSSALRSNTTGYQNTAAGFQSLMSNTTGYYNTAAGSNALRNNTTGYSNTAVGVWALSANVSFNNCAGLGYNTQVTGSNQVQLGDASTTTYVYGTVQNRSDLRDKADVRDTLLGLDFIMRLRPVDYRYDLRESYRQPMPEAPAQPADNASAEEIAAYQQAMADYQAAVAQWAEQNKLANITHDGTHKRKRYHHGLIAQEVAAVIQETGIDFGGYQNHAIAGGDDVQSIGYDELIAPLIKAVQQLKAEFDAYKSTHP